MSCVRCQVLSVTNHIPLLPLLIPPLCTVIKWVSWGHLAEGGGEGGRDGGRGDPPPANYPLLFTGGWLTLGWLQKPEEKKLKKAGNY